MGADLAKILVADDDRKLCEMIFAWFRDQDHIVEMSFDGRDAQERLAISSYDAIILDWDMPFISGLDVCKAYRQSGGTAPIIMLTGRSEIIEKTEGLDSGADDYVTKPFSLNELASRVRALLRRAPMIQPTVLKLRGLELDTGARQLRKNGQVIEVFPREMAILEFLIKHPDQVFSIEALQERIWPSDSETSAESLRVHIARLRSKIETADQKPILKTVHRQGYMIESGE